MNHNTNLIITGAVALIIGFLLGRFAVPPSSPDVAGESIENETSVADVKTTVLPSSSNGVLTVFNQKPGSTVAIASLDYDEEVWVTVRESAPTGSTFPFGNILGAHLFSPGDTNVTVSLLRDTIEGGVYHVVLYLPDSEGSFNYKLDELLVTDDDGEPVSASFIATSKPSAAKKSGMTTQNSEKDLDELGTEITDDDAGA